MNKALKYVHFVTNVDIEYYSVEGLSRTQEGIRAITALDFGVRIETTQGSFYLVPWSNVKYAIERNL